MNTSHIFIYHFSLTSKQSSLVKFLLVSKNMMQQHPTVSFPPSPPHPTHHQHQQGGAGMTASFPNITIGTTASSGAPAFYFSPSMTSSSALLQTKVQKTSIQFTTQFQGISGFAAYPGMPTMSPVIELQDRLWRLIMFPGGVDESCKTFISCFIECLSPGQTRAVYRLSVVNQMGWKNHSMACDQVRVFQGPSDDSLLDNEGETLRGMEQHYLEEYEMIKPLLLTRNQPLLGSRLHGEDKFLSWNEVKQTSNGHCVDDSLVIRVDLIVYGNVEKTILSSPNPFLALSRQFDANSNVHSGVASSLPSPGASHQISGISSSPLPVGSTSSSFPFPLLKDQLATMFNDQQSSDFVVKVVTPPRRGVSNSSSDDQSTNDTESTATHCRYLYLHKFILCLRSPVFKAMILDCSSMKESNSNELVVVERNVSDPIDETDRTFTGHINDFYVSYESLHEFFFFLYTDTCHIQEVLPQYAQELLALACKYQVEGLRCICEHYLSAMLAPSNALILLEMADTFGSDGLKTKALLFIAQNLKSIFTCSGGEVSSTGERNESQNMSMSEVLVSLHPRLSLEVLQAVAGVHPLQQQQVQPQLHRDDSTISSSITANRRSRAGSRLQDENNNIAFLPNLDHH